MLYTLSDLVAVVGPTFADRSSFTPTAGRFTLAESGPRPAMRARRSAHVAQSREPQQGEVQGVLRHPKGNFFDWGLDRREARGVLGKVRRLRRVVPARQAQEVARVEDYRATPRRARLRRVTPSGKTSGVPRAPIDLTSHIHDTPHLASGVPHVVLGQQLQHAHLQASSGVSSTSSEANMTCAPHSRSTFM